MVTEDKDADSIPAPPPRRRWAVADHITNLLVRRHRAILVIAALLTALGAWRASKLGLRTNFAELLPADDPAVVVLYETAGRMAALSSVTAVVEGPDPAANRRYVDELATRLRAIPGGVIDEVSAGVQEEQAFFGRNKFLYPRLADLEGAYTRLEREILRRKNPLYIDLDDDGGGLSGQDELIEKKERELLDKYPEGYFARRDRTLYAVVAWVKSSLLGDSRGEQALSEVRRVVASLDPKSYHPEMRVGLTGNLITLAEERSALENDLVMATAVCVLLVCLSVFLFYGRLTALPFFSIPAFIGVTLAMGFAELAFGYLNSSTAFMGTIIVGNGINFAIIQMARYEEERRSGKSVEESIAAALRGTWAATATASFGAAISYGSLVVTSFRGFNQFGYIGGMGMLFSWLATVIVLPALWAAFDRRAPGRTKPRLRGFAAAAPLARFIERHPRALLSAGVVLTFLSFVPLPRYAREPYEYDFSKLRNQRSRLSLAEELSTKLDPLFGRSRSPNFILAKDVSQVEEIRAKLRAADEQYHVLGDVKTINDYLPGAPEVQTQKLALLAKIRALIDANTKLLDADQRAKLEKLRPPEDLRVLYPRDLPTGIRRLFTEIDGTIGRPIVYQARENISIWDGRNQIKLAAVVQKVHLDNGETIRSSGTAVVFAAMLRAIEQDGPVVTAVAFLGVTLAIIFLARQVSGAFLLIGQLLAGVLWMIGGAAAAEVRINFLNFVALAITFGIGVDYGVNVYTRYRQEGHGRVGLTVAATGGAVALCSLTTMIGYAALLVADNHALRSFGALAILGEFACVIAALVMFPAALELLERRRSLTKPSAGQEA